MSVLDCLLVDYLLCEEGIVTVTPKMLVRERSSIIEVFGSESESIRVLKKYLGKE